MSRIKMALKTLGLVATAIVLTLFLYIASLGPVARMMRHGMPPWDMVMKVYKPLLPLVYWQPYYRYLEWWVGPFEIEGGYF